MNNTALPLGPAPAPGPERRHSLSVPQAAVLDELRRAQRLQPVARVAGALGLHANTARGHLDALIAGGLVSRVRADATGRGRPAWLYSAVDDPEPDARLRDYAGLAMALADQLRRTAADPEAEAIEVGRHWGYELAASGDNAGEPAEQVVELLEEIGFAPSPENDGKPIALRCCPLLDAARRYPDVVCRVHLGMVHGALEAFGGEPADGELIPFAEPGSCRLELGLRRQHPATAARPER